MTIATTAAIAGDTWTNVFTEETLGRFQYGQTAGAAISSDKLTLTFTFSDGTVDFSSDLGFTSLIAGIINGVDTGDTSLSGLAYDLGTFQNNLRDGDLDAINKGIWGLADIINGGASNDTIYGFGGSDTIYGNDGNDIINGGTQSDKLYGGNGDDFLIGATGNDRLYGNAGNDRLSGGAGNDLLQGGAGVDNMTGGSGADIFRFTAYSDFVTYNPNNVFAADFIRDFNHAELDLIDVHTLDANSVLIGNQDFTYIGTDAFHANTPGELRVVQINNSPYLWQVQLSTDNDTGVEYSIMTIAFGGKPLAADFVL